MTVPDHDLAAAGDALVAELGRRAVAATARDDGTIGVRLGDGTTVIVTLDNLARSLRAGDHDAVQRFADAVTSTRTGHDATDTWDAARPSLYLAAETSALATDEFVSRPVSPGLIRVLVRIDAASWRFVRPVDLERWGVPIEEALAAADDNLDAHLGDVEFEFRESGGARFGMVAGQSALKATLVFGRSLRERVEPVLGWPVLAVAPARDFMYLIRREGSDAILGGLGRVVTEEHSNSPYPITHELLEIGDDGVRALGSFGQPDS